MRMLRKTGEEDGILVKSILKYNNIIVKQWPVEVAKGNFHGPIKLSILSFPEFPHELNKVFGGFT